MSTPDTPSTSAWWVFEISAKRPPSRPVHDPELPERLRAVEPLREDPAHQVAQLVVAARLRQRGVAHVVVEVEGRVVHPERPPGLERREGELLAVARHEPQARLEVSAEVRRGRAAGPRRSRARPTCMWEDCFSCARKDASTALRRSLWPCFAIRGSLPATIGSVKLLGIVLAVQVALGLTLVALVATDNLPFTATARPTARRRPRAPRRSTASTARPPSGCCAGRWSWARARPARRSRGGSRGC